MEERKNTGVFSVLGIRVRIGQEKPERERRMKNFVLLDLETTGLTPKRKRSGSVPEAGGRKYSDDLKEVAFWRRNR